ncbi:hypothetical protein [Neobacillus sp. YIM B06451]|uniref:hypothetical protein n=1 Tax=Neobacillus sp. YIM B06451 TaxID=3070994 RepID=UPI0029300154|nr:hypothetical protein [Neobacillus sp. YIM B06451]
MNWLKTFKKTLRKITVENRQYYYLVNDNPSSEKQNIKIFPSKYKSTFIEVFFNWGKDAWSINLHKPSVCAALIKYALTQGWQPEQKNNKFKVEDGHSLISLLELEKLSRER